MTLERKYQQRFFTNLTVPNQLIFTFLTSPARSFSKKALSTPLARGGGRIVGGTDAYPGEFPHQVLARQLSHKNITFPLTLLISSNLKGLKVFSCDTSSTTNCEQKIASCSLFLLQLLVPELFLLFSMVLVSPVRLLPFFLSPRSSPPDPRDHYRADHAMISSLLYSSRLLPFFL